MLCEISQAGVEGSIREGARKAGTGTWKALKAGLRSAKGHDLCKRRQVPHPPLPCFLKPRQN